MAFADGLLRSLEKRGVDAVRIALSRGEFGAPHNPINAPVKEWLPKDLAASEHREARRNAETALNSSISRKALTIAERANKIAIGAMILSAATTIVIAVIQFIYARP